MMNMQATAHRAAHTALAVLLVWAGGCTAEEMDRDFDCTGDKCDIPDGEDPELCELRRADAYNDNQYAFTEPALRWSCNDVPGVTAEDRGQEYCEYFAIAQLPPAQAGETAAPAVVVGKNLGPDYTHGTTEPSIDLTYHQLTELENDPYQVVGQCVFTSWNSDIEEPPPSCDPGPCPDVLGVPLDSDTFRMTFEVNSAEAGQLLVNDCFVHPEREYADDFLRGCMLNAEINDTAFRKSDTTVCAAAMRMSECACQPVGGYDLAEFISPYDRRGFPLGTWSGRSNLPNGCRYEDVGDGSETVVTCDLTATDVIDYALDLKGLCQTKYADNVVVYVPMPAPSAIECSPSSSESPYAESCPALPWVLRAE